MIPKLIYFYSEVKSIMQSAASVKAYQYGLANRLRTKFIYAFEKLFESVDLIATPTTPIGSFKVTEADKECEFLKNCSILLTIVYCIF